MKCASCGADINHGYFTQRDEEVNYICSDCLLTYDKYRRIQKKNKYDHAAIYQMHEDGFCNGTIATQFGTNPLTVGWIIRSVEKGE